MLLLFVGSGCAALIYEIVWFQLLQFVIGGSAVSFGVLLGTFMGGMCLGSLLLPRVIGPRRNPLYVYAALELGIAVVGIVVLFGLPYAHGVYASLTSGSHDLAMRGVVAAVFLLPPTILMGATLPAIARAVEASPQGVSWLGYFYGGNIVGAVGGCLLAGFYLLRLYDMQTASFVAAAINVAVAMLAIAVGRAIEFEAAAQTSAEENRIANQRTAWGVYLAIAMSGASALGAEVVWTRLLSLMIGGTVYTFSIILAVFLIGLGLGSSFGATLSKGKHPRLALGICQLLLVAAIAWSAYQLTQSLPYWPIDPLLLRPQEGAWDKLQLDLVRAAWAILPAAILWGASFPLALGAAAAGGDAGKLVGGIYAANTLGAIAGALGFSVWLLALLGSQHGQQALMVLAMLAALLVLVPLCFRSLRAPAPQVVLPGFGLAVALVIAGALIYYVPATPAELIAHGRFLPEYRGTRDILEVGEGMNSSIAITMGEDNSVSFHVSGKVEASSLPQDMRLQRMLGHIPALVHPKPKSVLIVGCGAGVTSGSFVVHPSIERIVICELEPLIPPTINRYFFKENYDVVTDPRVEIVYDDARHYMLTAREKFDIITSDPIHPWVKGAASLYTREYFEMCKARLNPGGVVTQWIPLYESSEAVVKSELATFFEVFPDSTVWSNDQQGQGYDVVALGQVEPTQIDVDQLLFRLMEPDHEAVAQSLYEVGFNNLFDVLATYAGQASELQPWLADAQINSDRNLRLQYLAGLGASQTLEGKIYRDMVKHRTYPAKIFRTSAESRAALLIAMGLADLEP
jgi:spermidine synthase